MTLPHSPVLVVPVRNGGSLFRRCVESIRCCGPAFERVVVSVNGMRPEEDIETASRINQIGIPCDILCTQADLPAARHLHWLAQRLRERFPLHQRLVLLAHDDELLPQSFLAWREALDRDHETIAWLGDFEIVENDRTWRETALPEACEFITPDEWLHHNTTMERGHVFTNISGMSVPLHTLHALTTFWWWTGGRKGVRCEYMLLTHRGVTGIRRSANPIVRIHQHPQQEGRHVSTEEYEGDELRYRLWLLINAPTLRSLTYRLRRPAAPRSIWHHLRRYLACRFSQWRCLA